VKRQSQVLQESQSKQSRGDLTPQEIENLRGFLLSTIIESSPEVIRQMILLLMKIQLAEIAEQGDGSAILRTSDHTPSTCECGQSYAANREKSKSARLDS